MLHQISWLTYSSAIILLAIIYYAYVGLTFYRSELRALLFRLTGKKPVVRALSGGDFPLPAYNVAGVIQSEDIDFVAQEELSFGPPEENGAPVIPMPAATAATHAPDIHLLGDFSELISEVKTLIRVIGESNESKESFEMLFRLIVQKYPSLKGTCYETQLNDYLINEGVAQFPFSLTIADLQACWIIDNDKNQSA